MTRKLGLQSSSFAAFAGVLCFTVTFAFPADAAERFDRVSVNYVQPKDPAYHAIYQQLKEVRALERVQELLSPFRLPHRLLLKVTGCDGVSNAWYEENEITVCYEFLNDILKNAPEQTLPVGITRHDAILGPAIDVFLHESGHAMFDLLKVPIFGREEDAADTFSAYIMLHFPKEDAHRLILGSAYQYKMDLQDPQVTMPINKFSNCTGLQRSASSTYCVSLMALTRNRSPTWLKRNTSRRTGPTAVLMNTSRPLLRSRRLSTRTSTRRERRRCCTTGYGKSIRRRDGHQPDNCRHH
jgi:Putative metallopeptidase